MSQDIKERLSVVEKVLEDFIRHTNRGFAKLQDAQVDLKLSLEDLKEEMRKSLESFEKEMRESRESSAKEVQESRENSDKKMEQFRAEMHESRERSAKEMQEFRADMKASRENSDKEMEQFRTEMHESRERSAKEMQEFKNEMNRKWGELANKLGTLADDFVAPNIPFIAQKYFQCPAEPEMISVRGMIKHSRDKSKIREFDIITVYEDKVILNETAPTARQSYIDRFAEFILEFYDYFPEHDGRELVPIFATLDVNAQLVDYATRQGIYVLAIKEDTMDLYNYQQVTEGKNK